LVVSNQTGYVKRKIVIIEQRLVTDIQDNRWAFFTHPCPSQEGIILFSERLLIPLLGGAGVGKEGGQG